MIIHFYVSAIACCLAPGGISSWASPKSHNELASSSKEINKEMTKERRYRSQMKKDNSCQSGLMGADGIDRQRLDPSPTMAELQLSTSKKPAGSQQHWCMGWAGIKSSMSIYFLLGS